MTSHARAAQEALASRIRHTQEAPPEQRAEERTQARVQTERSRPVRRSLDLSPTHHARLAAWCTETAVELGAARITGQDVLRALVARLLTDETLARKIRADLADDIASR